MTRIAHINDIIIGLGAANSVVVCWTDRKKQQGRTIGPADSEHIQALMARFAREHPDHSAFPQPSIQRDTVPRLIWRCSTHDTDMLPTRDTTEYWDDYAQQWVLNKDFDKPYCPECGNILESEVLVDA